MAKPTEAHLCFDLGGTKLKGALITAQGRILEQTTSAVRQEEGYKGLLSLFQEVARELPSTVKFKRVSIASAGPLHPDKGLLLDPTNFFTGRKSWGVVPLVKDLKKIFRKPVRLENDAAAAVLGERWKGGHGKGENLIAITLGTGVGIGVIANGQLVRAGRGLHPEASHFQVGTAEGYPCGCGMNGCMEAHLAGHHFSQRLGRLKGRPLTGQESVALAEHGDVWVQEAFKEYGRTLAQAIRTLCLFFAPETVVLSGGFSQASHLFLPETQAQLPELLQRYRAGIDLLPKVKISKLQTDAGILGAAYLAKAPGSFSE